MTPTESTDRLQAQLRRDVRRFLTEEQVAGSFEPDVDAWQTGIDPSFSRRLARRGWVGMTIPTRYGGPGRTEPERFVVLEELLAAGAPVHAHWIAERQMAPTILRNGTEAQRHKYLPGIAAGERFFAIGMSEPDAGSDLAAVRTRARPSQDGWRITGTKLWTSGAHIATNLVLLARTTDSDDRHAGLSQFVVDLPHPDIHIAPIGTIDGGSHFNEVHFDDAFVPAESLLGDQGDGWRQVTEELSTERSGPERLLSTMPLLRAWAARPELRTDPLNRAALGAALSRLVALRQMSLGVAELLAAGGRPVVEAAIIKDLGTQFERDLVDTVRRHVGRTSSPCDDLNVLLHNAVLRAPTFTLRGGTNEILRSIIAKNLTSRQEQAHR